MGDAMSRYYYADDLTMTLPWAKPERGWQVFEEDAKHKGEYRAICLCVTKTDAQKIAKALNESRIRNTSFVITRK